MLTPVAMQNVDSVDVDLPATSGHLERASRPAIARSVSDFPDPDSPTTPTTSPRSACRVAPVTRSMPEPTATPSRRSRTLQ